jgi:hypothetical protein
MSKSISAGILKPVILKYSEILKKVSYRYIGINDLQRPKLITAVIENPWFGRK